MRTVTLSIPQLALVVATRAMGAAGIALLLGDRLNRDQRRAVGTTLAAVGVLTTFPLLADIVSASRAQRPGTAPSRENADQPGRPLSAAAR
jgi:hypothetical protein